MPHVLNLQIADICMQIHFVDMFVTDDYDTAYNTFLNRTDTTLIPDINLFLLIEKLPAIHDMKKIFDSEQSWSMFRQENNYFITLQPQFSAHPFWVARMNQNATEINVYCGDEIIHTKNNKIFIENPVRYPMDQIILMYYLSRRGGALFHAAGIEINKNGYIFAGRSGAGKTTISRQFIKIN